MNTNISLTKDQRLKIFKETSPKGLISLVEGLADKLSYLTDIYTDSRQMFSQSVSEVTNNFTMEACQALLESVDYGEETQTMESYDAEGNVIAREDVHVADAHKMNLQQMLENSASEMRVAMANQHNLNQLTPFDAFLPFTIIRSYLPLIGKDLIPTQTPAQSFIRVKQEYKYIVTKDNKKYLRPDIYNDTDASKAILNTAKGPEVTKEFYPKATRLESVDSADVVIDGVGYQLPTDGVSISNFNLLQESGGLVEVGDDLDIDVCIDGIRAVVEHEGQKYVIEQSGYAAYPDVTSISPQRSVNFPVVLPIKDEDGNVIRTYQDTVYGEYNAYTKSFNVTSLHGLVKQVQFGGHLSNKNNHEYLSFTNEYGVIQHPIPEGYRSNVPITVEDMQLFNETSSIDIVATAINEMTEIFTQLEDSSIIEKIDHEHKVWAGKGEDEHPFEHFHGRIVFEREVPVRHDSTRLLKRNEYVQDEIQYAVSRLIGDIRDVVKAEPFKVVAFCHPNVASLFVGTNVDWKITPGSTGADGIRTDYNMGIYTANGDSFRLISSQKIKKEDGVRFLIFPVNEQNFLSWKHFKYSMYFDRDHRNAQMQLVPNVMGMSRFYTHAYVPLQANLYITDWDN